MLLTNKTSIKDVMLFPAMKPNDPGRTGAASGGAGGDFGGSAEACEVLHSSLQEKIVPEMIAAFAGNNAVTFT